MNVAEKPLSLFTSNFSLATCTRAQKASRDVKRGSYRTREISP